MARPLAEKTNNGPAAQLTSRAVSRQQQPAGLEHAGDQSYDCLSVCLPGCLPVCLSVCRSICLCACVYPFVRSSVSPSAHTSVCLLISLSVKLFCRLSVCLFACQSVGFVFVLVCLLLLCVCVCPPPRLFGSDAHLTVLLVPRGALASAAGPVVFMARSALTRSTWCPTVALVASPPLAGRSLHRGCCGSRRLSTDHSNTLRFVCPANNIPAVFKDVFLFVLVPPPPGGSWGGSGLSFS